MKRNIEHVLCAVGCLVNLLGAAVAARQQPPQQPRFQAGVELVTIDVSVLDRDGRVVLGLGTDDFTVLEDGKPQRISTFERVEHPDVAPDEQTFRAQWVREVGPDVVRNDALKDRPVTVIVLDDATPMKPNEVPGVRRIAKAAIDRLAPGDAASVVFTMNKRNGQEFTSDHARLLAAVDRFTGNTETTNEVGPGDESTYFVPFDRYNRVALHYYLDALGTLKNLAEMLGALPQRRKAIIFVSVGPPLGEFAPESVAPGNAAVREGSAPAPPNAATNLAAQPSLPEHLMGGDAQAMRETGSVIWAALRANVNIYGVTPGGLRAPVAEMSVFTKQAPGTLNVHPGEVNDLWLKSVSENTGAFAVVDTNDFETGITRAYRANASYYLLGYTPINAHATGRFRKIEVKVNHPGVTVYARPGYWEPNREGGTSEGSGREAREALAPPKVSLGQALEGMLPTTDLPLRVAAAPFAIPGKRDAAVAVVLSLQQRAPHRVTRAVEYVDLRLAAFDATGSRKASSNEHVEARLSPGGDADIEYEVLSRLNLPPGRYQLRVAATSSLGGIVLSPSAPAVALVAPEADLSSRTGSVYCDLDVPDFAAPLTLSGVIFTVDPSVQSGPKQRLAKLLPIIPTAERRFIHSDRVSAFVRVYQGPGQLAESVSLAVRIEDGNGKNVFEASDSLPPARFDSTHAFDGTLEIPVSRFAPGPYLLTIHASRGGAAPAKASRSVRFEVR